jgi:hypothetical protein
MQSPGNGKQRYSCKTAYRRRCEVRTWDFGTQQGERLVERIKALDNVQLDTELRRLERDVEDFRVRAANVAATLEHSGRSTISDPLHQRLSSIHGFLAERLKDARNEASKRATAASPQPRWSLQSRFGAARVASGT